MKTAVHSDRRFWLLVIGIFAGLAIANYYPIFSGKIPFPAGKVLQFPPWNYLPPQAWHDTADIGDIVTSFYPFRALVSESVRHGTLPLWNPYLFSGSPFLANSQSALFYPLNLFYYVLPLPAAWSLALLIRMFLAGFFMTLFTRSIGASKTGAVFSGIVFACCGFMTAWQGQAMGDAAIWLPLICYALHRLRAEASFSRVALCSVAFAMPGLAGHPETAAHLTIVGVFLAVVLWIFPDSIQRRFDHRFALSFAFAGILAVGLACIQIIPTLEWMAEIKRSIGGIWDAWPLHQALGWVSRDASSSPNSAGIFVPECAAYAGMITLLAASLAPFSSSKRYAAILGALAIVSAAVAYSVEPANYIARHIPVLNGIKNGRLILVTSFALAALAGLGISALEEREEKWPTHRRTAVLLLSLTLVLAFIMVYKLQLATGFRVEAIRRPSFSRALLLIAAIPLIWKLYGGLKGRLFPITVCALAIFDLLTFSHGFTDFAPVPAVYPRAAEFEFLARANASHYRILRLNDVYPANVNMMYGISAADGYDLVLRRPTILLRGLGEDREDAINVTDAAILESSDRRLDMLNVKYLVGSSYSAKHDLLTADKRFAVAFKTEAITIFENKSVLPRAFAVPTSGIQTYPTIDEQLEILRNPHFNPEESVVLSNSPSSISRLAAPGSFQSRVTVSENGVNQVVLNTETTQPAVLVLSQSYYPGWKATVDGAQTAVFPANIALTGIELPAGTHDVRFVFDPTSFKVGAAITALAALTLLAMIVAARSKRLIPSSQRRGGRA